VESAGISGDEPSTLNDEDDDDVVVDGDGDGDGVRHSRVGIAPR